MALGIFLEHIQEHNLFLEQKLSQRDTEDASDKIKRSIRESYWSDKQAGARAID